MKQFFKLSCLVLCVLAFAACTKAPVEDLQSEKDANAQVILQDENQKAVELLSLAKQQNADAMAWIEIPSTDINNPIMQATDNDYYLRRDENKKDDIWGCYFADYYSVLADRENLVQNTVIYGHSDKSEDPNGKRFSQLFRYTDLEFLKQNPDIYITLGTERLTFRIFAVFFTDTDFYYIDPAPTNQGFETFLEQIAEKNEYLFEDMVITPEDKLLTLSACAQRFDTKKTGNHRFVVMGKLLQEGEETTEVSVTTNPNPKHPQ